MAVGLDRSTICSALVDNQGFHASLKVLEFFSSKFKALKVLEKRLVLEFEYLGH